MGLRAPAFGVRSSANIYTVTTEAHFSFKMSTPEARSTDYVDLTLDERFGYTRKTPYNHQVDACQSKKEIDDNL